MKTRHLIIAGILTFVVGLLVQAPAALLYAWIAPKAGLPVNVLGVDGTLTQGRATQIRFGNQVLVADIDWTLRPLGLLLGRLSYQLHSGTPPLLIDGKVSQGLTGTAFSPLVANGELRTLAAAAGQNFIPVNGVINLDLSSLQLRKDWPVAAEGTLQLNNLEWTLGKQPAPLGSYQAVLTTEDDQIVARISSLAGSVDISGEARAKPDRSYAYALKLKPKPDAPPMIANLMKQLGTPDAQGYYSLRNSVDAPPPAAEAAADGSVPPAAEPGSPISPATQRSAPPPASPPRTPEETEEEGLTFGGSG
ncbi:MAG TPA: type II secretion system protein N [Fontimonas sp.]